MAKRKHSQQKRGHTQSSKKKGKKSESAETPPPRLPLHKNPAVKYAFKVLCSIVVFYVVYWSMAGHPTIQSLYTAQATIAGELLSWIGHPNKIVVNTIVSQTEGNSFKLTVAQGCEALDTVCIIIIALLFYPGISWKSKLLGAIFGILLTQSLNIIRITSLYLIGIYTPDQFELAHYTVWPMLLIIWIVYFWWLWLRLAPLSRPAIE